MTEANLIRELMTKYDTFRAKWIKFNGTADGFDAWFTKQVLA